jgi:hypothetical protein
MPIIIGEVYDICQAYAQKYIIATLVLGLQLRQGLIKVQAMDEIWESHFMLPGV